MLQQVPWAVCIMTQLTHYFLTFLIAVTSLPASFSYYKSKIAPPSTFSPVKVYIEQIQMWTSSLSPFSPSLWCSFLSHFHQQSPQPLPPRCKQWVFPFPFLVKKSQTGAGRQTFHHCWQESTFGSPCMSSSSGWWNSQLGINNCVYTVYTLLKHTHTQAQFLQVAHFCFNTPLDFFLTHFQNVLSRCHLCFRISGFSHWQ